MSVPSFASTLCDLLQNVNYRMTATFTTPEDVGTSPSSMLWLLPLAASIAVVYKAMKLPTVKTANFIKEVVVLFGSIVVFIIIAAIALNVLAWLITE
ncbi:MAG: hypothetical protein ACYS76_00355 [Planctomycetota bacterium]